MGSPPEREGTLAGNRGSTKQALGLAFGVQIAVPVETRKPVLVLPVFATPGFKTVSDPDISMGSGLHGVGCDLV
jgi:hypothetical protein